MLGAALAHESSAEASLKCRIQQDLEALEEGLEKMLHAHSDTHYETAWAMADRSLDFV